MAYPIVPIADFPSPDASAKSTTKAPTPINSDGEDEMTEDHKRHARRSKRMAAKATVQEDRCHQMPDMVGQEAKVQ
jgi:hypothetical protein